MENLSVNSDELSLDYDILIILICLRACIEMINPMNIITVAIGINFMLHSSLNEVYFMDITYFLARPLHL